MGASMKLILKEIGSRINNIGTLVDTNPDNDETTSYAGKMLKGEGSFAGGIKDLKNMKDTAETASAASDKNIKDVTSTNTADVIEKAYKGLDDIIYRYNNKGQALGQDDKLRAGITAQSMEGGILESNVFEDPESGFLKVDTAQQTLANAAAIKILFEKIDELEKLIKG